MWQIDVWVGKMDKAVDHSDQSLSEEERSKDYFFKKIGELTDDMVTAHGKDFAMGVLVLAARFLAEGHKFTKPKDQAEAEERT